MLWYLPTKELVDKILTLGMNSLLWRPACTRALRVTLNSSLFAHNSFVLPICDRFGIKRLLSTWSIAIWIIACPIPLISTHLVNAVLCSATVRLTEQFQKKNIRWQQQSDPPAYLQTFSSQNYSNMGVNANNWVGYKPPNYVLLDHRTRTIAKITKLFGRPDRQEDSVHSTALSSTQTELCRVSTQKIKKKKTTNYTYKITQNIPLMVNLLPSEFFPCLICSSINYTAVSRPSVCNSQGYFLWQHVKLR